MVCKYCGSIVHDNTCTMCGKKQVLHNRSRELERLLTDLLREQDAACAEPKADISPAQRRPVRRKRKEKGPSRRMLICCAAVLAAAVAVGGTFGYIIGKNAGRRAGASETQTVVVEKPLSAAEPETLVK